MMRRRIVVLMLGVALAACSLVPTFAGQIQRADLDGSDIEIVLQTAEEREPSVTLDPLAGKIYWTSDSCPSNSMIQRADLDGSNAEVLIDGLDHAWGIALDIANQKMYWGGSTGCFHPGDLAPLIFRANLDGTDVEQIGSPGGLVFGIAVHSQQGKIYGTRQVDFTPGGSIWRANLDGSNPEALVTGLGIPHEIELDETNGEMYWTERSPNRIARADLDGSQVTSLVVGLDSPWGIALDSAHVYWTATFANRIQRANLDGSGVHGLVAVDRPGSIAIDQGAGKMYWVAQGEAIVIPAVSRRGAVAAALLLLVVATIALRRMT